MIYRVIILIIFISNFAQAQDLSKIKTAHKEIYLSGNIGVSTVLYSADGIKERKPSFSYVLSGAPTLHLYGIDLPFTFLLSNYQRDFRQPFNQFGISPYYKSLKLHIGYRNLNFSPFTLAGHRILGGGFEFNPGKLRLAFMYGRFNKSIQRDTTLTPQKDLSRTVRPSFTRMGFAAKLGYGTDRNYFDLIALKAKDEIGSIQSPDISTAIHPEENLVLGVSTQFYVFKQLRYKFDIGASAYSRDITKDSIDIESFPFKSTLKTIYTPRVNTKLSFAGEMKLDYTIKKFNIGLKYKRVEPGYQSMGTYYFRDDIEQYTFGLGFTVFKSKLRMRANLGLQTDNVRETRASQSTRKIGNIVLSYQPNQQFGINIQYANFGVSQNPLLKSVSDTTLLRNVTQSFMIMPRYTLISNSLSHSISIMVNYQDLNDKNIHTVMFTQMKSLNTNINYIINWFKSGMSINTSALYIQNENAIGKTNAIGGTLGLSLSLLKNKLFSGLSYTYTSNILNGEPNGSTARFNLNIRGKINKTHSLKLTAFILNNNSKKTQIVKDFRETTVKVSYNIRFSSKRKTHKL